MTMSSHSEMSHKAPKKRYGLIKAQIGSNHVIKGEDGVKRQYTTIDRTRHLDVKAVCVCFHCGRAWDSEQALIAAHPSQSVMVKNEEAHVYAWWSTELSAEAKSELEEIDTLESQAKSKLKAKDEHDSRPFDKQRKAAKLKIVGLLSDEEPRT